MKKFLLQVQFLIAGIGNGWGSPRLIRTPEKLLITDNEQSVEGFSNILNNFLITFYVQALAVIENNFPEKIRAEALDICCGSGHFAKLVNRHLNFHKVYGVDLSEPQLHVAKEQNKIFQTDINYSLGDMTDLKNIAENSFNLVTNLDSLHHVKDLSDLAKAYAEMDRVCRPDGMILALDLIRPKSSWIVEKMVKAISSENAKKNQSGLTIDYYYSLNAAFVPEEHMSCLPKNENRNWFIIKPRFVPLFQIIVGLPKNKKKLKMGMPFSYKTLFKLVPKDLFLELIAVNLITQTATPTKLERREDDLSSNKSKKMNLVA
ncbi:MAG: class I SAM-dependent methyltransferase [Bdellovibrionales bacterium]|nr:class I SAM-dependent methyltransferase [Bdellovibrionales bacterium]